MTEVVAKYKKDYHLALLYLNKAHFIIMNKTEKEKKDNGDFMIMYDEMILDQLQRVKKRLAKNKL